MDPVRLGIELGGVELGEVDPRDDYEIEIVSIGDEPVESLSAASPPLADQELASARQELAELRDKLLRQRADFENYRKRLLREREEGERVALAEPLRELLPVVDNLERAATAQGSPDDLRRGVELIGRQMTEVLRRFGLAEIPAVGLPFDPRLHEAVAREEDPTVERPTVAAEYQRGYWLNDRLLRPAMVRVVLPPEERAPAPLVAEPPLAPETSTPDTPSDESAE